MSRIVAPLACAVVLGLGVPAPVPPAPDPLWTATFQKDVKWVTLTPTGHLVASTDEGLAGLDPATGAVLWKNEEFKGLGEDRWAIIPLTQLAVITQSKGPLGAHARLVVFDYVDGTEKWNSDKLEILSGLGQYVVPPKRALLVNGRNQKGQEWVRFVRLDDGAMLWENKDFWDKRKPELFQLAKTKWTLEGNQEPLFDTDETMITVFNGKAVQKWNLADGSLAWDTELKELKGRAPAVGHGYAPILMTDDGGVIYVPAVQTVYAVRTADGSLVWGEKGPKLKGIPHQMELLPEGLLVRGGGDAEGKNGDPFLLLLDPATGAAKWQKPFDKLKTPTNFVVRDGGAFVWSDKRLYRVSLADGSAAEFAKDVEFEGGETPSALRVTERGFLLTASQNVMLVGFDGGRAHHAYHKAPGSGMFAKIASTALIGAVNVASATSAHQRAVADAHRSGGRGSASYSMITSNPHLSKRFTATKTAGDFAYILTNVADGGEKGPGLVKVNRLTGAVEGQVVLGDKEPIYDVDELEGKLFYVRDDKRIVCVAL